MADKSIWTSIGQAFGLIDSGDIAEGLTAIDTGIAEEIEKARAIPTDTLGSMNVMDIGGFLVEFERVRELFGERRFDTYDRMVKDTTIVAAGVRLMLNLLANAEWTVSPAEDQENNPRAKEIADLAYSAMFDMTTTWSTIVRKVAMYRFQGFSIMEWTAKRRDDGAIGFMDIENRPQRSIIRWLRDASGTVEAVVQRITKDAQEVTIPRSKFVYGVDDTLTDSPEGMGLYRHLAITAERLKEFMELEKIGYETDLRGIPIARAPLGELQAEVKAAPDGAPKKQAEAARTAKLKPLRDFISKHVRNLKTGLMLPSDTYHTLTPDSSISTATPKWAVELLNGNSTSFDAIAKAIVRMNEELARLLGVEHLLLGTGGTGSLALAQSKIGTFYLTITSTLMELVEIFERDFIGPLADLNGWPEELIPSMGVSEINEMDIEMVSRVLMNLATAGATVLPTDPAIPEMYEKIGLTPPPVDANRDALLAPDTGNQDTPLANNPEDQVTKRRVIKSARGVARQLRADMMKRAA